jgi:hypothetical protein
MQISFLRFKLLLTNQNSQVENRVLENRRTDETTIIIVLVNFSYAFACFSTTYYYL